MLSVCQPVELAKNQGRVFTAVLASGYIYWTTDGAVIGRAKVDAPGRPEELVPASAHEAGYDLVVAGQTLFWGNDWNDNGLRGCALLNCSPQTLVAGSTPINSIYLDPKAQRLYWDQGAEVWAKDLPAGVNAKVFGATARVTSITSDDDFIYWVEQNYAAETSKIQKRSLKGGATLLVAGKLGPIADITIAGAKLYAVGGVVGAANVYEVPLPNGIANTTPAKFASAGTRVESVKADATGIYWAQSDGTDAGSVRRCPITGCSGEPEIIAPSPAEPRQIAVDAEAIYWVTESGYVMKVAK